MTIVEMLTRAGALDEVLAHAMAEKYLTIAEVAERYAVSQMTVRRWVEAGKLAPALKIEGGSLRFSLSGLAEFERDNRWERKEEK